MEGLFESRLLPQRALILEARLFQNPVGGRVSRQCPGLDAVQREIIEAASDDSARRLAHQPFAPGEGMQLISELGTPSTPVEAVEADGAEQTA